jgi:hypothetical protein
MEEWIRERGYVMWLGALGVAATSEEPRVEQEKPRQDLGERAPRRDERPARADEAWLPR